jgi:O-methyltransferase
MTLGRTFRRHFPLLSECVATIAHRTYAEDGLITRHTADFVRDPQFVAAYAKGKATGSWGNMEPRWRVYTACSWARRAAKLAGDFVECGVNRGGMPVTIMEYISFNSLGKRFYLLDTYCGIPQRYSHSNGHSYSDSFNFVTRTFKPYPGARIIQGIVPDTLPEVDSEQICFLSIDMNSAEPEVATLEFFWRKLVPGAVVLLDDYAGGENYRAQKTAMDTLAQTLGTEITSLPTGQGLIIR